MNTFFEVVIAGSDPLTAHSAARAAFLEIDRAELLLSRFRPESDVAHINRAKPGETVMISLETHDCLRLTALVHAATSGAFDPSMGAVMDCLRRAGGDWQAIDATELAAARLRQGISFLELNQPGAVTVRAEAPAPVALDLGAVGKGFALDLAAAALADWELSSVLLNAGGSTVLALGDEPWTVGVGGSWGVQVGHDTLPLRHAALSGSGSEVQGLHIADPRSGGAARHHLAAWAIAPVGALSDAFSTAFLVMDTAAVEACCAAHPGISALVVEQATHPNGTDRVVLTAGFSACTKAVF